MPKIDQSPTSNLRKGIMKLREEKRPFVNIKPVWLTPSTKYQADVRDPKPPIEQLWEELNEATSKERADDANFVFPSWQWYKEHRESFYELQVCFLLTHFSTSYSTSMLSVTTSTRTTWAAPVQWESLMCHVNMPFWRWRIRRWSSRSRLRCRSQERGEEQGKWAEHWKWIDPFVVMLCSNPVFILCCMVWKIKNVVECCRTTKKVFSFFVWSPL